MSDEDTILKFQNEIEAVKVITNQAIELVKLRAEHARLRSAAEAVLVATVLGGRGKLVPIDSSNALEALRRALESDSAESEA
jgi:hypothetical protein